MSLAFASWLFNLVVSLGIYVDKLLEFIRQNFVRLNICWFHLANRRFQMLHAYFFCFKTLSKPPATLQHIQGLNGKLE